MNRTDPRQPGRFARAYGWIATTLLGTALSFLLANLAAALLLGAGVGVPEPGALGRGTERLRPLYPGLDDEEIRALLAEVWTRPYVYEPYTQFREDAFSGRYLNIRSEGFRSSGAEQPWPPDARRRNVFVFGGSTAFGYGVADGDALPARLGAELDAKCDEAVTAYNFARSNYFSTQERILFEQLAAAGRVPAMAVFVDGLNEFAYASDEPKFTARLAAFMRETPAQLLRRWLVDLPLPRLVKGLRGAGPQAPLGDGAAAPTDVLDRWLLNKRLVEAVARELGVATLFVWQPVPVYGLDPERHPFAAELADDPAGAESLAEGYRTLDELRRSGEPRLAAPGFLWLADAHAGLEGPLYVDRVHYSTSFNQALARRIAEVAAPRLCGPGDGDVEATRAGDEGG